MRFFTALLAATLPLLASGQAQLLPHGEFAARDGRPGPGKSWKVTDTQGQLLADALNAITAKTPVVIDYEHQTLSAPTNGQPAPAAGWIKHATWRAGEGLFADVEWTAAARARIEAGEYRFISPVITFDSKGVVTGVLMGALTNYPALLGMDAVVAQLKTLFNLQPEPQETDMALLVALLAAIGLPTTATEAEALSAVSALTATAAASGAALKELRAELALPDVANPAADQAAALTAVRLLRKPDPTGLAAMAALQSEVAALTAQLNGDKLVQAVDGALTAGKLIPAQREWALELGRKDFAALTAFIAGAPVMTLNGQTGGKALPGEGQTQDALSAQVARAFGLTAEQFALGAPKA